MVTIAAAALAGPVGAAAALAAPVAPSGDRVQAISPASAVALAVIGLAALAVLVAAARRRRHRSPGAEEVTIVLPPSMPGVSELDRDLLVSGALAQVARVRDGRGSQSGDRTPDESGPADGRAAGAPVWVRRLDERIPIMPTHRNVPVDNDRPVSRARQAGRAGGQRRERGDS